MGVMDPIPWIVAFSVVVAALIFSISAGQQNSIDIGRIYEQEVFKAKTLAASSAILKSDEKDSPLDQNLYAEISYGLSGKDIPLSYTKRSAVAKYPFFHVQAEIDGKKTEIYKKGSLSRDRSGFGYAFPVPVSGGERAKIAVNYEVPR